MQRERETIRDRTRELFLLRRAERRSKAYSPAQLRAIRTHYVAATRRLDAAEELRGVSQEAIASIMLRQAALFWGIAYLVSKDANVDPESVTAQSLPASIRHHVEKDGGQLPPQFERVSRMLLETGNDAARTSEGDTHVSGLHEDVVALAWMSTLVDPRSPKEIRVARFTRVVVPSVLLAALLVVVTVRALAPPNRALNKVVASSSQAYDTVPQAAVDGEKNGRFGFHSAEEDLPWLSIDLGQRFAINKIYVYGRGDSCYYQSIPLAFEVSDDATTYRKVAERTEEFSEYDPWVIRPAPLTTRYLRLRTQRRSVLVLGEVEVYGKPSP